MQHDHQNGVAQSSCKSAKESRKDQLVQIGVPATPAYWKSLDELHHGVRATGEFPGGLPSSTSEATRRDFLAMMGFTLAAAGLAGCRAPVQNESPCW